MGNSALAAESEVAMPARPVPDVDRAQVPPGLEPGVDPEQVPVGEDQEAVAGYSLSGRVLLGLRVDRFSEEGLETFETGTDRAASVAPLEALSSGPIIPLGCPE